MIVVKIMTSYELILLEKIEEGNRFTLKDARRFGIYRRFKKLETA